MNANFDFFISFSNKDLDTVSKIVDIMQSYKADCWFQKKDSRQEYAHAIMTGIKTSRTFIVFLSKNSANSMYVLNEIRCAIGWYDKNKDYKILPVIIDKEDIPEDIIEQADFYLGRMNMLYAREFDSLEELVLKIFEQSGFEVQNEKAENSLYNLGENEIGRLSAQNQILNKISEQYFDRILTDESLVLDVGCADGSNITSVLGRSVYGKLLGIDINENKIKQANELYGSNKNTFSVCDINSENFDDVLDDFLDLNNSRGFDVIYMSFLLLHIAEPLKLLKTLRHYLNKNGKLYIQDFDDGANLVYPYGGFFNKAFNLWENSKESGDRFCGRKIPIYLRQVGYNQISILKSGISTEDIDLSDRPLFWDVYFNYDLWEINDINVFRNPTKCKIVLDEYKADYDKYKEEYDNGNIFVQLGFMIFLASK